MKTAGEKIEAVSINVQWNGLIGSSEKRPVRSAPVSPRYDEVAILNLSCFFKAGGQVVFFKPIVRIEKPYAIAAFGSGEESPRPPCGIAEVPV